MAASIILILVGKLSAPIPAISADANTALFFMLSLVIIIATETLPAGLIGIVAVAMLPILGLTESLAAASALFGNQLFFYTLACFAISAVMTKLPIGSRILLFFLKRAKSTKGIITALLVTCAVLSMFISNFSAALLVYMVGKQYLSMIQNQEDRKKLSGTLMIGLVLSAGIFGFITPVSNSGTVLVSTYLADAGYTVSFGQWLAFGFPIAAVWLPIMFAFLFKLLPPPEQSNEAREGLLTAVMASIPERVSKQELLAIFILGITFVCWILNINAMIVSCCCCIALLFPGFGLISWKDFNDTVGWGSLLMICGLIAAVSALSSTGVFPWLIELFSALLPPGAGLVWVLVLLGLCIPIMLILIPNAPALVAVLGAALIPMAEGMGIHPVPLLLSFCAFVSVEAVIPIGSLTMIIYDGGRNFRAKDMPKIAIPTALCAVILCAIWAPIFEAFIM